MEREPRPLESPELSGISVGASEERVKEWEERGMITARRISGLRRVTAEDITKLPSQRRPLPQGLIDKLVADAVEPVNTEDIIDAEGPE